MNEQDAETVHSIHCACLTITLSAHYSQDQISAWKLGRTPEGYIRAIKAGEHFLVAEIERRVIAFASWQNDELLALFVHPDAQGNGLGSRLLKACFNDADGQGGAITNLKAALGAEGFYANRGFVSTGPGQTIKNGIAIPETRMVVVGQEAP